MKKAAKLTALLADGLLAAGGPAQAQMEDAVFAGGVVSTDGAIRVPEGFRTDYVLLGAWSVAGDADTEGEIGLHVVYAPRSAMEGYRSTGAFPDGTVLVKELFPTATGSLTTGEASHANAEAGIFVMVKDDTGRFPESPLWGDGWGWSFFVPDDQTNAVTEDYQAECLACHEPARATDLVYVQAYPVLDE